MYSYLLVFLIVLPLNFNPITRLAVVPLICVLGLVGIFAYFLLYSRKDVRKLLDHLLLMNMVFNLIVLLSAFCLLSLPKMFNYLKIHSNSHIFFTPFLEFMASVGVTGSAVCIGFVCADRFCIIHQPGYHQRLTLKKIAIAVPLVSILSSMFILFKHTGHCYKPGNDTELFWDRVYGLTYENSLRFCGDGEKAFNRRTYLRYHESVLVEGHKLFIEIVYQVVPFVLVVFFLYKNYRLDIFTNPEYVLTKRTIIASTLFLLTNMANFVPVCFDVYAAVIWLKGYILGDYYNHPSMPGWVLKVEEVAHFLAIVPPALYSYIFCGPEHLLAFCKNVTAKRELLMEDEIEEEDCYELSQV